MRVLHVDLARCMSNVQLLEVSTYEPQMNDARRGPFDMIM